MDPFRAFGECQTHLEALGRAHTELLMLEAFHDAVARAPTPGASELLRELASLFALSVLERERAWYLEAGSMEPVKSRAIRAQVEAHCATLRAMARELVDAWDIPDPILDARDA